MPLPLPPGPLSREDCNEKGLHRSCHFLPLLFKSYVIQHFHLWYTCKQSLGAPSPYVMSIQIRKLNADNCKRCPPWGADNCKRCPPGAQTTVIMPTLTVRLLPSMPGAPLKIPPQYTFEVSNHTMNLEKANNTLHFLQKKSSKAKQTQSSWVGACTHPTLLHGLHRGEILLLFIHYCEGWTYR